MIKPLGQLEKERNFFNLIKGIYGKPIVNIILNDERPNANLGNHSTMYILTKSSHYTLQIYTIIFFNYSIKLGEKDQVLSTKIRKKTKMSDLITSIHHCTGSSSLSRRKIKEIKGIQNGKKK